MTRQKELSTGFLQRENSNVYDKININNKQFGKKAAKHMRENNARIKNKRKR